VLRLGASLRPPRAQCHYLDPAGEADSRILDREGEEEASAAELGEGGPTAPLPSVGSGEGRERSRGWVRGVEGRGGGGGRTGWEIGRGRFAGD
jgi:hypothetical protein